MAQNLYTYADLAAMPEDGKRREILDGELIVSPSPFTRHQELVVRILNALYNHVEAEGGGRVFVAPLDIILSDANVVEPDVFVVLDEQRDIITDPNIKGVPALVVEVLSNSRMDRIRKRDIYARFGVPEYWIVDPDSDRVEVYRHSGEGYEKPAIFEAGETLTYGPLPGFELDLAKLFRR